MAAAKPPKKQPTPRKAEEARARARATACAKGQLKKVKALLAEGADPKHGVPMVTAPLVAAASGENVELVRLLLELGAPLDEYGAPAVAYAATRDDDAVFTFLVERGALTTWSGPWTVGYSPHQTPLALALHQVQGAVAGSPNERAARKEMAVATRAVLRLLDAGADPRVASGPAGAMPALPLDHLLQLAALYEDDDTTVMREARELLEPALRKHGA